MYLAKHPLPSISPHPTPKNRRLSNSTYHRELEEVLVVADSHLPAALAGSAHQIPVHSFLVPPNEHLTAVAAEWGAYFARLEFINQHAWVFLHLLRAGLDIELVNSDGLTRVMTHMKSPNFDLLDAPS